MARTQKHSDAKTRFLAEMQTEMPTLSPLGVYLNHLSSIGEQGAAAREQLEADLIETFTSETGLRALKLFEKSVLLSAQPNGSSDGALRETNAVRNFVLEIRRLVSHG